MATILETSGLESSDFLFQTSFFDRKHVFFSESERRAFHGRKTRDMQRHILYGTLLQHIGNSAVLKVFRITTLLGSEQDSPDITTDRGSDFVETFSGTRRTVQPTSRSPPSGFRSLQRHRKKLGTPGVTATEFGRRSLDRTTFRPKFSAWHSKFFLRPPASSSNGTFTTHSLRSRLILSILTLTTCI